MLRSQLTDAHIKRLADDVLLSHADCAADYVCERIIECMEASDSSHEEMWHAVLDQVWELDAERNEAALPFAFRGQSPLH